MENAADLLSQAAQPKREGIVIWFDNSRGFGFIQPRDGGANIFVHFSAIQTKESYKTLLEGQPVEFEETTSPKGPRAVRVRSLE